MIIQLMNARIALGLLLGALALAQASRVCGATATVFAGSRERLADPFSIGFDQNGNAFISEMTNNRVVKIDAQGKLTPFAGTTHKGASGDGGPATAAELNGPHHLIVMKNGDVLIADSFNAKIRRVDAATGVITTFAGSATRGFGGDGGPATQAQFAGVYCLAVDPPQENLFVADLENHRIRAMNLKTKIVRTVAGNGQRGVPRDGSDAARSPLADPRAVAVAKNGVIYVLERSGNALRAVDRDGRIRTVAGTGRAGPFSDVSDPLAVTFRGPKHLCTDAAGDVLIADSDNDVIRKYLPGENKMIRVAGTGKRGSALSSDPLALELRQPHGVTVDASGRIYVCDSYNGRVFRIE